VCEHTFVRWSQQTIEAEEGVSLPGYRDEAVVRHFEAPDSVPTRFYEVRAKSILNRVPEASQMPFRWTINPYRGCTHACSYCVLGSTPVLMADGRHRPIEALQVGDEIYGTRPSGTYRHYARATVLDTWISVKPAFRVVLADGTELVLSGDHRLLTDRGWKHVMNTARGERDRPHLTRANSLVGTGRLAPQPVHSADYRHGYLTGIIRGDGHLGTYSYDRPSGGGGTVNMFRLALADDEALGRSQAFLSGVGIATRERLFSAAADTHREIRAIVSQKSSTVDRLKELIRWPNGSPPVEWARGFLAGVFDAEGGRNAFAVRISNTDPEIVGWTEACARGLGFDVCRDAPNRVSGAIGVRVRGGLAAHLRFFHLTDPAILRKRSIDGQMVKTFADLRVVAIEPLGCELPLYDITTTTGDFIADGVVSHNCFARPTHTYLDFDAGRDFEREIVVKVNAPERLRAELRRPSWRGEHIALGTNTDPYQWAEGRYRLMRGIWQTMIEARNPGSVLTKSPLLLRDLDLMVELNRQAEFTAALSVPTIEERAWRATEPHTPNPRARLEAVAKLTAAGIRTGVLVAPLMPGINDDPEQVREILRLCTEAGAAYVTGIALHLRGEVRQVFMEWLRAERPELVDRYRELYRRGAYAPAGERRRLAALLERPGRPSDGEWARGRQLAPPPRTPPSTAPGQERLFDPY
jgi:DNA repair photolyase